MNIRLLVAGICAAAACLITAAGAGAQSSAPARQCFQSEDWNGWTATPDAKAIYIRVSVNRLYRLDLAQACSDLRMPGVHLVNKVRGSSLICNGVDLDLRVSEGNGFETPCIVADITPLSAAEAAALPRKLRP